MYINEFFFPKALLVCEHHERYEEMVFLLGELLLLQAVRKHAKWVY